MLLNPTGLPRPRRDTLPSRLDPVAVRAHRLQIHKTMVITSHDVIDLRREPRTTLKRQLAPPAMRRAQHLLPQTPRRKPVRRQPPPPRRTRPAHQRGPHIARYNHTHNAIPVPAAPATAPHSSRPTTLTENTPAQCVPGSGCRPDFSESPPIAHQPGQRSPPRRTTASPGGDLHRRNLRNRHRPGPASHGPGM